MVEWNETQRNISQVIPNQLNRNKSVGIIQWSLLAVEINQIQSLHSVCVFKENAHKWNDIEGKWEASVILIPPLIATSIIAFYPIQNV